MRKRSQRGSLRKVASAWVAQWWEDGHRRSRTLGRMSDLSETKARRELAAIVAPLNLRIGIHPRTFEDFVEHVYFPFYERKWKGSTLASNQDRVRH